MGPPELILTHPLPKAGSALSTLSHTNHRLDQGWGNSWLVGQIRHYFIWSTTNTVQPINLALKNPERFQTCHFFKTHGAVAQPVPQHRPQAELWCGCASFSLRGRRVAASRLGLARCSHPAPCGSGCSPPVLGRRSLLKSCKESTCLPTF